LSKLVRPKLTESFPFNYMLKSKLSLSCHFEYANKQITYHFWLWGKVQVAYFEYVFSDWSPRFINPRDLIMTEAMGIIRSLGLINRGINWNPVINCFIMWVNLKLVIFNMYSLIGRYLKKRFCYPISVFPTTACNTSSCFMSTPRCWETFC
jgi:hypothetical protein